MAGEADGEPGAATNGRSKKKSIIAGVVGHVAPILGGKITGGVIIGAVITLTGFGPEHWFAVAFENLGLTNAVTTARNVGIDYRLVLVAVGVAIIAFDVFLRSHREPVAAPTVGVVDAAAPVSTSARTRR